jgi:putative hydrolases of HD superfamily
MHKKLKPIDHGSSFPSPTLTALSEIMSLKSLYRQGWIQQGISKDLCESVADHSFSTSMMAWILAIEYFPELNAVKVLQLAMIHEIGEIHTGDITPIDNIPAPVKHEKELESVHKVLGKLKKGSNLIQLWDEFETGKTPEADFVRQIDKLDMAFQALHYEKETGLDLHIFLDYTDKVITDEKLREVFKAMRSKRDSFYSI